MDRIFLEHVVKRVFRGRFLCYTRCNSYKERMQRSPLIVEDPRTDCALFQVSTPSALNVIITDLALSVRYALKFADESHVHRVSLVRWGVHKRIELYSR